MYYREREIVKWAEQKGIIDAADRLTQSLKTIEEIAELIKHFLKGQDIQDDIGDIYVTIVVQANMNGFCIQDIHQNPYNYFTRDSLKGQIGDMVLNAGMLCDTVQQEEFAQPGIWLSNIYNALIVICDRMNLSLPRCIDIAYDEIKGRTGKMVDGVFVKNE
jgi:NTP pyrophosphatase (non-canonical NTP hydrolase)